MTDPAAGRTLGAFTVEREIGRGGMGVVWLVRQGSLDRPAVLKKLRRELSDSPELRERFEREARAAAAVHHQNVVAVYDCFRHRGDQYIAQEYVAGVDLHAALAKAGPAPPRVAGLVALEVARGLEEIHAQGTIHRDLKPHNVLLGQRGEVKIADFGIALASTGPALTRPGIALGSPPYMAPEQMMGDRVDARADLFALGVVLYEMLAGQTPYPEPGENAEEEDSLLERMRRGRYPRLRSLAPEAPRWMARLTRACLKGRARRRPSSAAGVRAELDRRLGRPGTAEIRSEIASWLWSSHAIEANAGETIVRVAVPPPAKRSPLLAWAAAGLACGATVGTLMFVEIRPASVDSWIEAAKESLGIEAEAGNDTASPEGTKTDPKSEKTPAKKR